MTLYPVPKSEPKPRRDYKRAIVRGVIGGAVFVYAAMAFIEWDLFWLLWLGDWSSVERSGPIFILLVAGGFSIGFSCFYEADRNDRE